MQKTLVLLKPDAVQKSLIGAITSRFESKGLKIVGMKMITLDRELCDRHYAEHVSKGFYPAMSAFMMSSPIVAMAVEGHDAIKVVRTMCGATNPADALPGTIRGDFAKNIDNNIVHSSDGEESALREVSNFFSDNELFSYGRELAA